MLSYRYDKDGYFVGAENSFLDPLESKKAGKDVYSIAANCTFTKPGADKPGYVQKWNGSAWGYVEDHTGLAGYVDGKPFEIKEYGPFPAGWSETPPPPTTDELYRRLRNQRDAKLAETDFAVMPDYPLAQDKLAALHEYRQALRDLPAKAGAPWTETTIPWPVKPQM